MIAPEVYARFADDGLSNRAIARRFGVSESTVRRGLASIEYKRNVVPEDVGELEERFNIQLDKPLEHNGNIMLTADWHIPLYDPAYVNRMLKTARAESLDTLCIAGDFFNFDALSQYDPKQEDAGLERELREGVAVMRVLLETFDTIYYLWGNHDARMHRALGYALQFKLAMKMVFGSLGTEAMDRIVFTNLDHMWVEGHGEYPWYVCHPKSYARTPLNGARQLAVKHNANVACAHSHHCAVGYAVDGHRVVAELGGLFDRSKTAYLQRSTSFPNWQQGYGWLKNGQLYMSSPGWNTLND
jgi:hypothetical protein